MKRILMALLAVSCFVGVAPVLRAQDQQAAPPKVLVIYREMLKFGKDAGHEKNEAAFARAEAAVKSPDHYLAVTSLSGADEAWFMVGFDSYAGIEKAMKFGEQPAVQASLGPLNERDGDYISDGRTMVATLNDKWSYNASAVDIAKMRYFEIETIRLRAGHDKDWEEIVDLYKTTAEKVHLDEQDVFFEVRYGTQAGTILIVTPRKSLEDLDAATLAGKGFFAAMGDEGQKRWAKLLEESIDTDSTQLFSFSPKMSYPTDEWIKADPGYWKPKAEMAAKPAAGMTKKPAADEKK